MSSSRWHTVQEALWKTIERAPAGREAFLAEYCAGDPDLLAEVHALLEAHEEAGGFLVNPHETLVRRGVGALLQAHEQGLMTSVAAADSPVPDRFLGRAVSHYQIFEKLGEGGMGVVYKARDTRLDRVVALKFPASHLGDEDAKARLIREARAASALDHVNICTVHEIGETEAGQVFIAMACYAGETLKKKLERNRLPIDEILGYAVGIAQGLTKAHERGIVHRDIKPANVMVTEDSVVKLLDFGLARAADERLLRVGAVRATPAYMSPEQARGEPVDHRSDIWSLGVTIYEMLTGKRPFRGSGAQTVIDGILNDEPTPIVAERPEVPDVLAEIVSRTLAKSPLARYASARELLDDLERLRSEVRGSFPGERGPAATRGTPAGGGQLLPGGERVQVTAVVWVLEGAGGATAPSDPEDVAPLIRETVAHAREVVRENGGVVQYAGPGKIVALFGVPAAREDDGVRAALSALEVVARARERTAAGLPEIAVGAGIDTGLVLAREPQPRSRSFRVAGSPLRFAAHLARHAGPHEVLASPASLRLLERVFDTEDGLPLRTRGSAPEVTPARILRESTSAGHLDSVNPAGLSRYVGRSKELETLLRCFRQAAAGGGQLVTVMSEAGLGKSRLLYEFRHRLERRGVTVLQGRCSSRSGYQPFQPFIEALRNHLGIRSDASERPRPDGVIERILQVTPELEAYIPLYLHLLSIPSEAHPLPAHLQAQPLHRVLVNALAAVFTLGAREDPLVLLLDDWQWSDDASRDVLEQLVELIGGYPVLVVVTFRPEYEPSWSPPAHQTAIRLQPLDAGASARIIESALHAEAFPPDAAAAFHERAGGNPFFLEEICRTVLEEGTVRVDEGRAVSIRSLETLILPHTVQAVIRARLHRLDGSARSVLRMASVLGRTFTWDVLEQALRSDPGISATLERSLDALRTAGLIYRTQVLPEATYRFRHVLTLETAYESMPQRQRRRAHRLVGRSIEEHYPEGLEEQAEGLAHHFGEAQDWRKRAHYSRLAGDWSYRLGQLSQAIALYQQAREALDRLPEDSDWRQTLIAVLLRQEQLYEASAGDRARQQETIDELLALLGPHPEPDTLAEVHVRQADLHILLGRFAEAEVALDEALRSSRRQGNVPGEQKALRSFGFLRWHQDRHEEALSVNTELIALDRQRGDTEALVTDLMNLLTILKRMKDFDRGRACVEELLDLAERLDDRMRLPPLYNNVAEFYRAVGDSPRALSFLELVSEIDGEHPLFAPNAYALTLRAQILIEQGRTEESIRCYQEVIAFHRSEQSTRRVVETPLGSGLVGLAGALRTLGGILGMLQRGDEGLPYLEEAATLYGRLGNLEAEAALRVRVAAIHLGQGRYEQAQLEWEQVASMCRASGNAAGESRALEGQGKVARRQGDNERALSNYHEALRLAETAGDELKQGELNNTLGILAWHRRAYEEALEYYQRALTIYERRGEPTHAGHMLASIGATLHKLERPGEAVSRLDEAIRLHRTSDERQLEAYAHGVLGDVHVLAGRHAEARSCYAASLSLRQELGDRRGEGWMLLRLASVDAAQGDLVRSRAGAARAAAIAVEVGDERLTKDCRTLVGRETDPADPHA